MTTHTAERITRAGHRQITTESGKALFEVFSGAVGTAEADANEERLVTVWNSHDKLAAALEDLMLDTSPVWNWVGEKGIGKDEYKRRSDMLQASRAALTAAGIQ